MSGSKAISAGTARRRRRRGGQSLVEFMFVGIPLIFVLISIFEMSRGMWVYHTLANAAKAGVRYASVHGYNCAQSPNACTVNMGTLDTTYNCGSQSGLPSISTVIWCNGVGLDPGTTMLTFADLTGTYSPCALNACLATVFPSGGSAANFIGAPISIQVTVPFKSMIALFWPGSHPFGFGSVTLPASSTDTIKF